MKTREQAVAEKGEWQRKMGMTIESEAVKPKEDYMSGKLIEVIKKLEEAKHLIKEQQKEIDKLNKLINILKEYS